MRVLFICTGNTCRSPMAEYIFNEVSGDFDSASSCGFAAMPGDTINENSLAALAEIGIDASYHRSRRFDLYMADEADFLFVFTPAAKKELEVIFAAVAEISRLTLQSFEKSDPGFADAIEALEETVDGLKEELRSRHIKRLQAGECTIVAGFVWSDLLTDLERVSDHCSNVAGCLLEMGQDKMDLHDTLRKFRSDSESYRESLTHYSEKYALS